MRQQCSILGCGRPCKGHGWCNKHYQRFKIHGDPEKIKIAERGEPMRWLLAHISYRGKECLIWPFARDRKGYGCIAIAGNNNIAANVMCEKVNGVAPSALHETAHSCGNGHGGCINPSHLRWATPKENSADRLLHGTDNRGQRNGNALLSEENVTAILYSQKSSRWLAKEYKISADTVRNIRKGKRWKHLHSEMAAK